MMIQNMKTLQSILLTVTLFVSATVAFPQARVQFIHNSADMAAEIVDVWVDQDLKAEDFTFRNATAFMDLPAGQPLTVAVTVPDSPNPSSPLWSQSFTLTDGEVYIFVARGILSATGYEPAPPFGMDAFAGGRENALVSNQTDMLVQHGATDVPAVDIYETGVGLGLLVGDLAYGSFDGYHSLDTKDYMLEVRDASNGSVVGTYRANFQTLGWKGYAITVMASGFLNPASNSNGPAFGLWGAVAAGGPLVELPLYDPKARVQFVHNSADASIVEVDLWMDQTLIFDDLPFRNATPFLNIPAARQITLAIAPADSQTPDDPIWSQTLTLDEGETYLMVAEGIVSPSGYNPPTPFGVAVFPTAQEQAINGAKTDLLVHHGSTDAPVIDIYETRIGLGLVTDNLAYAGYDGYHELSTLNYILEVRDQAGTGLIAAYRADFQTMGLEGDAVTLVASGFLDPAANSNGPAFGLWLTQAAGGALVELPEFVPVARVQVIHNSADVLAQVVDIWLDDELLLDDLAFRYASPFIDAPAGYEFTIAVTEPDAAGPENPLWAHTYTLTENARYLLVAEGILSTSGYDPAVPFDIAVYPQAREEANVSGQTDVLLHHGSTDCPAIDVIEVGLGIGTLTNDLQYGQFAGYLNMATINYIFQIKDFTGLNKIAAFRVPLATLGVQGDAVTLLTSGFLEPDNNSNGPEFGLWMAKASGGELIKMPEYNPLATAQFIHNSADTALSVVDLWVDNDLVADNMSFRSATAFIDVPAIEKFVLSVCGPESQNPYTPLWVDDFTLTEGETYVMVAGGLTSPTGFDPYLPFDVEVYPQARESAVSPSNTDLLIHHGVTDAPAVDIFEIKVPLGQLVDNLAYTGFNGYHELATENYILEVRDPAGTVVGSYRAALETFQMQGEAVTVVASGFLDPASNSNGETFGLWAARPDGGALVEFPVYAPSARVQVIHNSADTAAALVDIWMDQALLLDDFEFRTATPFAYLPANQEITIAVKKADSQDPGDPLYSATFNFTEDATYILIASGILSLSGFNPAEPFTITLYEGAHEYAANGSNTEVLVFHGSTDAPVVDIVETGAGAGTLVDNIAYGEFEGYLDLPTANYSLDVRDEAGTTIFANFAAPFSDMELGGQSLTLLASGFIEPGNNSEGAAFGLLAVQADGTATMLVNTTGIGEPEIDISSLSIYPNPASEMISLAFVLERPVHVELELSDITGRTVRAADMGRMPAGTFHRQISADDLPSGMYILNLMTAEGSVSRKILVR